MMRNIVKIDQDKCIGCGKCAEACVEGAIKMIDDKAVLVSEAYCDGLGACLPSCPTDAITIEMREVSPFAEPHTVNKSLNSIPLGTVPITACPGSGPRKIVRAQSASSSHSVPSQLSQWPIQLRLIPPMAPYLENCDLLIAADCSAFAYGDFHDEFIKDRIVVIGCPKLDPQESWRKLMDIFTIHAIRSVVITRMDVPCCSGIVNATISAIQQSGKNIPVKVFTIFADGKVVENPSD